MQPVNRFLSSRRSPLVGALALVIAASLLIAGGFGPSSPSALSPPTNGPRRLDPTSTGGLGSGRHALANATVHRGPGVEPFIGTVVIRDGLIERVDIAGPGKLDPAALRGVQVHDLAGMHVYAGFIDAFVEVDAPMPDVNAPGSHWSPRVTPQRGVLDGSRPRGKSFGNPPIDDGTAGSLRSMGFVAAALSPKGGNFRGSSAVVSLAQPSNDPSAPPPAVYKANAYQAVSLDSIGDRDGKPDDFRWTDYPSSQMGAIALVRQALIDADWQVLARRAGQAIEPNCLDAIGSAAGDGQYSAIVPPALWFDSADELEALRGDTIAKEFNREAVIVGSGREFRRLDAIAASKRAVVVPLNYPVRPRVATLGYADSVSLEQMMIWEQGPTNARRLSQAGVPIALTTGKIPDKLGGRGAFPARLSMAIKHGLTADQSLAALTTTPAKLLGVESELGTIEPGKHASFVVADRALFGDKPDGAAIDPKDKPAKIMEVWIDGQRHEIEARPEVDVSGTWELTFDPVPPSAFKAMFEIDDQSPPGITIVKETGEGNKERLTTKAREVRLAGNRLTFIFDHAPLGEAGVFTNSVVVERVKKGDAESFVMHGDFTRTGGTRMSFTAVRVAAFKADEPDLKGRWRVVAPAPGDAAVPEDLKDLEVIVERDPDAAPESKATTIRARRGDRKYTLEQTTAEAGPSEGGKPGAVKGWVRYRLVSAPVPPVDTPALVVFVKMDLGDPTRAFISTDEQTPEQFRLAKEVKTPETDELASIPADLPVPFEAYGRVGKAGSDRLPAQENVALVNATIWTCNAKNEVIEEGAVLIEGGKIRYVGPMGKMPALPEGAKKQDLRGMHVTPGLIDAHSHTGISKGVNEGGQAVTAEVRIGDVTDPDSVSWYRQLAGGVTCVNSMHGSANPIGGQTQTNKVRWGVTHPDQMHMEGAKPGIKFALGENVKQSNWGPQFNTRYPQSRMGVEGLIRDRFVAAREYMEAAKRHRDLELDALTEILRGERLIHCHSYRQDEILMLCRVADEFGFKIGTFQHGLECYKVAREVKEHAIGASIFTDWWAYKMEVQDAIPYDGPILHDQGVVVSFNSDSDELARRLKDEAIKASKYSGGQPRAKEGDPPTEAPRIDAGEALRFVTINPATQLGIADRVGSIEVGKDADLAVWSLSPSSTYSRCETTYVDGRRMFSRDEDGEARMRIEHERARLIQKILGQEAREKGSPLGEAKEQAGAKPDAPPSGDDAADAPARRSLMLQMREQAADLRRERYLSLIRRGLDPRFARCTDCGEMYEGSR